MAGRSRSPGLISSGRVPVVGGLRADRFKVAVGSAKEQVRVAQALEEMSEVREAFSQGAVDLGCGAGPGGGPIGAHGGLRVGGGSSGLGGLTRPVEELRRVGQ